MESDHVYGNFVLQIIVHKNGGMYLNLYFFFKKFPFKISSFSFFIFS